MKIAILDKGTLGEDINLTPLRELGETAEYEKTAPDEVCARIADADVVVINKIKLNEANLPAAKKLRLICVAATGYDNIDTAYCRANGIALCNVPGYSTESVALSSVLGMRVSSSETKCSIYSVSESYQPLDGLVEVGESREGWVCFAAPAEQDAFTLELAVDYLDDIWITFAVSP